MPKYYKDCTLEEMFEFHDHTYAYSDDFRAYENGRKQYEIIEDKVKSKGGWTKELVNKWNKYAPNHSNFQKDWEWMQEINK